MIKIRVINDTHLLGPLELFDFYELLYQIKSSPWPVILNGDIIDLKNCDKTQVPNAMTCILALKKERCIYIGGNHELNFGNLALEFLYGNTYLNHSHLLSNFKRYIEWDYRKMDPGASTFKRKIVTPAIDSLRHLMEPRPNSELIANIKSIKKSNPKIKNVILGHAHPTKTIEFDVEGVKCLILPRGVNDLTIDGIEP